MNDDILHELVIYNDNIHDYAYIIACLIKFCNHNPLQAEQCALIANNAGKCSVKVADPISILHIKAHFDKLDIKSKIKDYEKSSLY